MDWMLHVLVLYLQSEGTPAATNILIIKILYQHEENKNFNTILTNFIYLQSTFYTNIEVSSVMITHKKLSKHVGVVAL